MIDNKYYSDNSDNNKKILAIKNIKIVFAIILLFLFCLFAIICFLYYWIPSNVSENIYGDVIYKQPLGLLDELKVATNVLAYIYIAFSILNTIVIFIWFYLENKKKKFATFVFAIFLLLSILYVVSFYCLLASFVLSFIWVFVYLSNSKLIDNNITYVSDIINIDIKSKNIDQTMTKEQNKNENNDKEPYDKPSLY